MIFHHPFELVPQIMELHVSRVIVWHPAVPEAPHLLLDGSGEKIQFF